MFELYESDSIYFQKTKEYFKEVLSNYYSENYRSAVVMLYSIAICDILYKLQELRDVYNDTIATKILDEIEKTRNQTETGSKSKWEKDLIDQVHRETEMLDDKAYSDLCHLFDHRNFSAHPALNSNYELITPSRETTISDIKNTLNNILTKPPIFAKKAVDMLVEDIADRKRIFYGDEQKFKNYLISKYFSKMSISMKKNTFRSLWKLCFKLPDDQKCIENRNINRKTMEILFCETDGIIEYIRSDNMFSDVSMNSDSLKQLCVLLSHCPSIYAVLNESVKLQIDKVISEDLHCYILSWFKSDKKQHIQNVIANIKTDYCVLPSELLEHMKKQYEIDGLLSDYLNFCIRYYGSSGNFNTADRRYVTAIHPYLKLFDRDQFIKILNETNNNDQIYRRYQSTWANSEIVQSAKSYLGTDFDYSAYQNFKFDVDDSDYSIEIDADENDGEFL